MHSVGWTTKHADLEYPVGFAENSFGVRDIDGSKISVAFRQPYIGRGFGWKTDGTGGDVLGCLICLPHHPGVDGTPSAQTLPPPRARVDDANNVDEMGTAAEMASISTAASTFPDDVVSTAASTCRDETAAPNAADIKKSTKAADDGETTSKDIVETLNNMNGGHIRFFLNGKDCGVAFDNISRDHKRTSSSSL